MSDGRFVGRLSDICRTSVGRAAEDTMTDSEPVDLLVAHVAEKDDKALRDLGLTDQPSGPPSCWVTVHAADWPGRWPPRLGDVISMYPARITEVTPAPRRRASASKSVGGLAGSPDRPG